MTRPFMGRPSWVMGFPKSPGGGMSRIWFRTAGVLFDLVSYPPNAASFISHAWLRRYGLQAPCQRHHPILRVTTNPAPWGVTFFSFCSFTYCGRWTGNVAGAGCLGEQKDASEPLKTPRSKKQQQTKRPVTFPQFSCATTWQEMPNERIASTNLGASRQKRKEQQNAKP